MKISVFGDGINDYYHQLASVKTSAGKPVYELDGEEPLRFPGGALNAAAALTHFCDAKAFAPVMVDMHRHVFDGADVYRVDRPRRISGLPDLRREFVGRLREENADAIVVSDYDKGMVDAESLSAILGHANRKGIPCVVDAKRLHGLANYRGGILKCNEAEAASMVSPESAYPRNAAAHLADRLKCPVVITRAAKPPIFCDPDRCCGPLEADLVRFPCLPFQSCGAGDAFASFLALGMAQGEGLQQSVAMAYRHAAAAGLFPPFRKPLLPREVQAIDDLARLKLLGTLGELKDWLRHRVTGPLVVTNGCFDLLHSGHVRNLEECRRQGNHLLVLVNSDASVRRLKGEARPIHCLADRMRVLASLYNVDAVTSFSEDTPADAMALIVELLGRKIDVHAKGGDAKDTSGAANAIRSHRTQMWPGSTTATIEMVKCR